LGVPVLALAASFGASSAATKPKIAPRENNTTNMRLFISKLRFKISFPGAV
jgi:hypothetical protein